MTLRTADDAWQVLAPAKVNLDLRMRGLRADGYHLVSTVLQSIALADTLVLRRVPGPFRISCDTPGVPLDAGNLAWRGAAAMAAALGITLDGLEMHLMKRVPAEAGLGGGSSDAVAAARLVAHVAGVAVPAERLADVVRPLGADVAFFARGGTMRGEGIGDELTPLPDVPRTDVLIVRPAFGVSTGDAYAWYDADAADGPSGAEGAAGPWRNDLEAPVAARHAAIRTIVERLRAAGAQHAAMSGSGSACFGLFAPGADTGAIESGWPSGTRLWRSRLLSAAEYAAATACVAS